MNATLYYIYLPTFIMLFLFYFLIYFASVVVKIVLYFVRMPPVDDWVDWFLSPSLNWAFIVTMAYDVFQIIEVWSVMISVCIMLDPKIMNEYWYALIILNFF